MDGRVTPGQFFILKVDLSLVDRSPNIAKAHQSLEDTIADSFWAFYKTYSTYLGGDGKELLENIAPQNPARSLCRCVDLVQKAISKARDSGEERLAGVQGVRIDCSVISSLRMIANLKCLPLRSTCSLTDMTHLAMTTLTLIAPLGRELWLKELLKVFGPR